MDKALGSILGPPHGITPAAVIANENIKIGSFKSSETTQRKRVGQANPFLITNPTFDGILPSVFGSISQHRRK